MSNDSAKSYRKLVDKMKEKQALLEKEIEQASAKHAQEIQALEHRAEAAEKACANALIEVETLRKDLETAQIELERRAGVQAELHVANVALIKAEKLLDVTRGEISRLDGLLGDRDAKIHNLQKKVSELEKAAGDEETRLDLQKRIQKLRKELADEQTKRCKLEKQLAPFLVAEKTFKTKAQKRLDKSLDEASPNDGGTQVEGKLGGEKR